MEYAEGTRFVLTFRSTTDALRAEEYLSSRSLSGRLIPLPTGIRADCGMGWMCLPDSLDSTVQALKDAGIQISGIHDHFTRS